MKRKVFAHAKSIDEINIDFFKSNGVKTLFVDLDNTLDSYKCFKPTDRALKTINNILDKGLKLVIVSNNRGKRVTAYANSVNLPFIANTRKPFAFKIDRYVKEHNLNKNDIMMVGDQMVTDVGAANRAGIRVVLTDKIVKEDQWTTKINRFFFGNRLRKKLAKKGLLKDWRDCYEKCN